MSLREIRKLRKIIFVYVQSNTWTDKFRTKSQSSFLDTQKCIKNVRDAQDNDKISP